jgi:FlaG/FlaF family flagellin (archaellin)
MKKHVLYVVAERLSAIFLTMTISYYMALSAVNKKFEALKTQDLQVESVTSTAVYTGYVSVRPRNLSGEQPSITINAGPDFAGIQVNAGDKFETVWVERE